MEYQKIPIKFSKEFNVPSFPTENQQCDAESMERKCSESIERKRKA